MKEKKEPLAFFITFRYFNEKPERSTKVELNMSNLRIFLD